MAIYEDYYVINSNSHIKSVPNFLCTEFLKELKNDDGTLKADDPATKDVNEAWEGGKAPIKTSKKTK